MLTWCMAHPWMTFFIVIFALAVIDSCIVAIANAIIMKKNQECETEQPKQNEVV